jgi:hypothetical protein
MSGATVLDVDVVGNVITINGPLTYTGADVTPELIAMLGRVLIKPTPARQLAGPQSIQERKSVQVGANGTD